jgi:N-acetyl-anhydromuramyl-L-alanine amidase AmpD
VHTDPSPIGTASLSGAYSFRQAQYDALRTLLPQIVQRWSIPAYNVVGLSDVATDAAGLVGTATNSPGPKFLWTELEALGLGIQKGTAAPLGSNAYDGFFFAHPGSVMQAGASGMTNQAVAELKSDLLRIGYQVAPGTSYDASVENAVAMFCEHFLGQSRVKTVAAPVAEEIKSRIAFLAGVKP